MDLSAQEEEGGWPLGLEPVHLHKRVLDTLLEDDDEDESRTRGANVTAKISNMSSSDATSGLETESSCSSRFFPEDKPVTLGEILGMSLNHLATGSFRSIELHVLDHSSAGGSSISGSRNRSRSRSASAAAAPWMICRCARASSTSSNRFDESSSLERIYTNSIFEQDEDGGGGVLVAAGNSTSPLTLLEHFRRTSKDLSATAATENPLFLLECGSMSP